MADSRTPNEIINGQFQKHAPAHLDVAVPTPDLARLADMAVAALRDAGRLPVGEPETASTGHVLVTFLVTRESEHGHPMDTIVKRVVLADDGTPTTVSLERLTESIAREVTRKAAVAVRG